MSATDSVTQQTPLLEGIGIRKRFGGETALDGVDFAIHSGEVHGLVGSNGAGKSTLMKILAGAVADYEGELRWQGTPVRLDSPQAALRQGIAMVYQELSGIGQLSVAENVCLGRQPTGRLGRIDWPRMVREAQQQLHELDLDLDVTRRLDRYPLVIRQMVEIARGLHSGAQMLILDEPTSALSPPEARKLFELIGRLRERGVAIVFISHFLEDVLEICDRVTILKDGQRLETTPAAQLDKHYVIHTMLGHSLEGTEAGFEGRSQLPPRAEEPPRLVAKGLSRAGAFQEVNLEVAPGECLGIYGFVGAGHQELAHALAGALEIDAGTMESDGVGLKPGDVHGAVGQGVVLVAADRGQTVVHAAPIYQNVTLAHLKQVVRGWITPGKEIALSQPLLSRVGCQPALPWLAAGSLSGGNQQKVVMAKWLLGSVRVLVLEEPTRGMDVGAKEEIMALVHELQRQGTAVVLCSTEPEMVLAHAQRIMVMRRGRVASEWSGCVLDKAALMREA
jgi:ribose transport system ATP-binding protein